MAILSKGDRSRKEFLKGLRGGKLTESEVKRGLVEHEFKLDEVLWCVHERDKLLLKFGMFAIGRSPQHDKIRKLFQALKKETAAPRRANLIKAIVFCKDPDSFAEIGRMTNTPDIETRSTAQSIFVRIDNWGRQRDMVVSFLEDPNEEIAFLMTRDLIQRCPKEYEGYIRHLTIHESDRIRGLALNWLIEQRNPDNAEVFFSRIPLETGKLRKALLDALGELAKNSPAEMTDRVVQSLADGSADVRNMAIELYTRLPNRMQALHSFLAYAASTTDWIRDTMYKEAAKHADAFVDPLLELFKDDGINAEERHHAFGLAYALKHPRLARVFIQNYEGSDWFTQYQVLQMLAEMNSPDALPVLMKALETKQTRLMAIQALGGNEDPGITKSLKEMLPDSDHETQKSIIDYIGAQKEPRNIPYLTRFLERNCDDVVVAEHTAETIAKMCDTFEVPMPGRVSALVRRANRSAIEKLPDLGLRLEPD